ncbi:MAG: transposase [Candidatus Omnitrophota bacterium]
MPRFPRVNLEGALYYITTKADYKLNLFRDEGDNTRYISFLAEYKQSYNFKLYAFVLTSKESHLLIEPSQQYTVSQIMHDVNANYTKYYNKKYEKKGHLFEERFKAVLIEKNGYLLKMTRFIHRIPLKAGSSPLCDYRWSSYLSYIGREEDKNISANTDYTDVLNSFPVSGDNRMEAYRSFTENPDKKELLEFESKMHRASVVGSEEFMDRIKQILDNPPPEADDLLAEAEAWRGAARKKMSVMALVLAAFILIFLGVNSSLWKGNAKLKREIKEVNLEKDEIFARDLIDSKKQISRELEEKYRADMVSYKAAAIRLQELENKERKEQDKDKK